MAIISLTQANEEQEWFTEKHTHDAGATSQKVGFFPVELNNYLFGEDSFDLQYNHNQKVDIKKDVATERGAQYILIDASNIESDEDF